MIDKSSAPVAPKKAPPSNLADPVEFAGMIEREIAALEEEIASQQKYRERANARIRDCREKIGDWRKMLPRKPRAKKA